MLTGEASPHFARRPSQGRSSHAHELAQWGPSPSDLTILLEVLLRSLGEAGGGQKHPALTSSRAPPTPLPNRPQHLPPPTAPWPTILPILEAEKSETFLDLFLLRFIPASPSATLFGSSNKKHHTSTWFLRFHGIYCHLSLDAHASLEVASLF